VWIQTLALKIVNPVLHHYATKAQPAAKTVFMPFSISPAINGRIQTLDLKKISQVLCHCATGTH